MQLIEGMEYGDGENEPAEGKVSFKQKHDLSTYKAFFNKTFHILL